MKFGKLFVVALGCLVLVPAAALAQSSIAGQVTDNTGGVLPGVTVEAASPALIEGARVVVTDGTGQYNIIDLRPGTYALTFTLPGFGTQVRDELALTAEQAMTIDVAMSVGAVEESVTVSGASPVVDVQQVQRVEVLSREVQEAIPTGRSIWSYAQLVPGVRLSKPDVGGLSGHQQATISGPGASRRDTVMEIDGQDVSMYIGDTWMPYLNPMLTAETSYTTTGIGAETQRGGLRINMVPKEGGNQFSGSFFAGGSPTRGWQGDNWTQRLGDLGIQSIQQGDDRDGVPHLDRVYDLNMEIGGPIIRDRLWFLGSARRNIVNNQVLNSFNRDGSPGLDTNSLTSAFARLTYQITPRNKFSAGFDKLRKRRFTQHGAGDDVLTAANSWTSPHYDTGTAKWTSTVSSRMLLELGFSLAYEDWDPGYQPGLERQRPDGFVPVWSRPVSPPWAHRARSCRWTPTAGMASSIMTTIAWAWSTKRPSCKAITTRMRGITAGRCRTLPARTTSRWGSRTSGASGRVHDKAMAISTSAIPAPRTRLGGSWTSWTPAISPPLRTWPTG